MVMFSHTESDVYYSLLREILDSAKGDKDLFETIVNAPFSDRRRSALMGLGIVVLLLVNKATRTIDRVALSDTDLAKGAVRMSVKPFHDIKIPINYKGNFIAEAIRSERYQQTSDWQYLFAPELTPEEARLNQAGAGISCSFVYPLIDARAGGAIIYSYYLPLDKFNSEHHEFMRSYAKLVSRILRDRK
jgi:hypothetical protein